MNVAKSKYIKVTTLFVFCGITLISMWRIHFSVPIDVRFPYTATEKIRLNCTGDAILCGINRSNLPDFNALRSEFHSLMTTIDFHCPKTLRFGRKGDGGYETCMTKAIRPNNKSCLVYSFGIAHDWSYDEAWAKYGCEVHSFDPSIGLEDHVHSRNVTFHNLGLWGTNYTNRNGWKLERLSTIRRKLGHEKRIIDALKVDIEGGEWPFLRDVIYTDPTSMSNVRQLYIELHTPRFRALSNMTAEDFAEINYYVRGLRDDLGFQLYKNAQSNNCCGRFSNLMPPGVRQRCCYEAFFFNSRLLAA